jgi:uncharacterized protein YhhL (DUF1145 family)
MEDIRKQDFRLFFWESLTFGRIAIYLVWLVCLVGVVTRQVSSLAYFTIPTAAAFLALITAYSASIKKRFQNKRMEALWGGCEDRLNEVFKKTRKSGIADLQEMPKTIRNVADSLYFALRRADIIAVEVAATESGMLSQPPVWQTTTQDAQSMELYRIADLNIAEYRAQFAGVLAGVQRTEAQSAVFMTTVDSLRMKLIGYRLVGRNPSLPSEEFLGVIAEARLQLDAIDHALEELDLGHYPKNISVIAPRKEERDQRFDENRLG